jgi:hypothetical protein
LGTIISWKVEDFDPLPWPEDDIRCKTHAGHLKLAMKNDPIFFFLGGEDRPRFEVV